MLKLSNRMMLCMGMAALGSAAHAQSSPGLAEDPAAVTKSEMSEIELAAIETLENQAGEIASAPVGETGLYVVYLKSRENCGSGGCRAQVWMKHGSHLMRKMSLPVGYLPIVSLPSDESGMPMLGVTVYRSVDSPAEILPVAFDGKDYSLSDWDALLPAGWGEAILTDEMLRSF